MRVFSRSSFILFLILPALLLGQSRLHSVSFYSASVHDTMHVRILLPANYDRSRAYPVFFLLHGHDGDETDWTAKTGIVDYTVNLPMIIVMPAAKNSWYVNSESDPSLRYEDYIMYDLPKYVNSLYPIDTTHEAIAGLSMGGYGALDLALRHPNTFQFVGDLSGALTIPGVIDSIIAYPEIAATDQQAKTVPELLTVFGKDDKKFRDDHNVFTLFSRDHGKKLPYFYCVVGVQDWYRGFLTAHRILTDMMRADGVIYEYHEVPGEHNWKFWDQEIEPLIARMAVVMKPGK